MPTSTPKRYKQSEVDLAIATLNGMTAITKNEMLRRGIYVGSDVVSRRLKQNGAICGGHQMCAIGSLVVSHRVATGATAFTKGGNLIPSVDRILEADSGPRGVKMRRTPGLRLALEFLNAEAEAFIEREGLDRDDLNTFFEEPIEMLFESSTRFHNTLPREDTCGYAGRHVLDREVMLDLLTRARRQIRKLPIA